MESPPRVRPRASRIRCAFCHDALTDRAALCGRCGSVVHPLCAGAFGRCPTLGCGASVRHAPIRRFSTDEAREARLQRSLEKVVVTLLVAFASFGVIVGLAGGGFRVAVGHTVVARTVRAPSVAWSDEAPAMIAEVRAGAALTRNAPVAPCVAVVAPASEPGADLDPRTNSGDLEVVLSPDDATERVYSGPLLKVFLRNRGAAPIVVAKPFTGVGRYVWSVRSESGSVSIEVARRRGSRCGGCHMHAFERDHRCRWCTCDEKYKPHAWLAPSGFVTVSPGAMWDVDARFESPIRGYPPGRYEVALFYEVDAERLRTAREAPTGTRDCCSEWVVPGTVAVIRRLFVAKSTSEGVCLERADQGRR